MNDAMYNVRYAAIWYLLTIIFVDILCRQPEWPVLCV